MTTITFPYLDYSSIPETLDLLKRFAKKNKTADPAGHALSWYQDQAVISLGFKNWSLLHKHVDGIDLSQRDQLLTQVQAKPVLGQFVKEHAVKTIVVEDAVRTMKDWAREKYTPLVEFAYLDNESANGSSWPEVDIPEELIQKLIGDFPEDLIEQVGKELDAEEGPWCLETTYRK